MPMMPITQHEHTKNTLTDAITNLHRFFRDKKGDLGLKDIYPYDEMGPITCPALSIVFDNARPSPKSLGTGLSETLGINCGCSLMDINVIIYLYLETLNLGKDTGIHLERLGNIVTTLYSNTQLYGVCHSEPMMVTNASLMGRRLASSVYLTGVINVSVPIRF